MRIEDLPEIPPWDSLTPARRKELLEEAERLWDLDETGVPWARLPEKRRIIAARVAGLVGDERSPSAKTYACRKCWDVVYVVQDGNTAWFCDCRAGVAAEAGHWFARLFPAARGRKGVVDQRARDEFNAYLSVRKHGLRIRDAVNRLKEMAEIAASTESE